MSDFIQTQKIYSILELNNTVRRLLKVEFPEPIWVCGEIQDYKASKDRRHIYFNLVQKHPEINQIIAQVSAKIFESHRDYIFNRLKEIDPSFELKNDIEVKLKCEVDLYPKGGSFGLIVVDIDPFYTIGKLAKNRLLIIEELKRSGLLEENKKRLIGPVPLKIGLITALGSAAYHDFIDELQKSNYGFKIFVYDCYMQGELVEDSIILALNFFNSLPDSFLDVIVITRGGGSTADLSWFDSEKIAKTVALSKFPVISALGHQINITITDMVANLSVKTPTKGAQFLIEKVTEFLEEVKELEKRIFIFLDNYINLKKQNLENLTVKIQTNLLRYFHYHNEDILAKKINLINYLENFFYYKKIKLLEIFKSIKFQVSKILQERSQMLEHKLEKVNLLKPENILKRGYSITLLSDKILKSIDKVAKHDIIKTILYDGRLQSEVITKEGSNDKESDKI
ncbi:MAG: exodeoxyribonuclease VII large subunit [Candidatus Omnitrophica bacterium]|nr:exodeoxyribonuclease VII large subunit [Candidatus Omnitrophota bacterium]MCM8831942.1 exodeoxyribonuclease VII large subunit [Candidatus Omnitrophota bacterium]